MRFSWSARATRLSWVQFCQASTSAAAEQIQVAVAQLCQPALPSGKQAMKAYWVAVHLTCKPLELVSRPAPAVPGKHTS